MLGPRFLTILALSLPLPGVAGSQAGDTVEFCLRGEYDLGARLQGMTPAPGEFSPARWCVITEDDSDRVQFHAHGKSNPDMTGGFTVNYLPPGVVRIVNADSPPDLEFQPADIAAEALRYRRIDPRRLANELMAHPEWVSGNTDDGWHTLNYPGADAPVRLRLENGKLRELHTTADMPLRGRVPVEWRWDWRADGTPEVAVSVDGDVQFRAHGRWRVLDAEEASAVWQPSGGEAPRQVPGEAWPSRTRMTLETLVDNVYLVKGVRTGFHHLVIDTGEGLVVGDAPAGWVEMPQIPPADLVPGLGISGLSERLIDFLREELPGRPIRAVVLTHAHDDHAGGARAFAAAGADVYAPAEVSAFLTKALNRPEMPNDRLSAAGRRLTVKPVENRLTLNDENNPVELYALGPSPHTSASLGMLSGKTGHFFQSDLHVPTSDEPIPRANRLETECWFAGWAVENLAPETVIVSSHSTFRSPVARLAGYLDHDLCQKRE